MHTGRTTRIASSIVAATGALWGLYWVPARRLAEIALPGAWGALAIVAVATVLLAPLALRRRRELAQADPWALSPVALGGAAFVLYSVGFVYGRVAIVILLFFLTPVWSTLIGRYVMGWHLPRLRASAIAIGLAGLVVMLAGDGAVPIPRGPGEWLALLSGLLLMAEVLVGAVSAALLAGERLGSWEIVGGVLVLGASILEIWPTHGRRDRSSPPSGAVLLDATPWSEGPGSVDSDDA